MRPCTDSPLHKLSVLYYVCCAGPLLSAHVDVSGLWREADGTVYQSHAGRDAQEGHLVQVSSC